MPAPSDPPAANRRADRRLIAVLCLAQVGSMLSFSTLPALLPGFIAGWQLSNTEAGWLNGILFAGYVAAVPFLMGLTDRIDARRIFLASSLLSAVAMLGFALWADGFWSALALRALAGAALAGAYMPGMRVLTDRLTPGEPSRAVAWYTATYGIGTAASFSLAGLIDGWLGWRCAFALTGLGPLLATVLVVLATGPRPPTPPADGAAVRRFDFPAVFANRRAFAYIAAYTLHTAEMMAMLSWLVAFLAFAAARSGSGISAAGLTTIGAAVSLLALPASILGNEGALRLGRRRFVSLAMAASAAMACLVGASATLPFAAAAAACLVYGVLVASDSASLTAGTVGAAEPGRTGATIAMHTFLGFSGGFLGPLAFGAILDLAGGREDVTAWGLAFAALGLATLMGPLALRRWAEAGPRTASRRARS